MQATTTSTQGPQALGPPVPQPNVATPGGPTPSLLTVTQSPGNVSGPSSAVASSATLHSPATGSGRNPTSQDVAEQQRKIIRDAWIDAEGEIPVLNKDDASSLTPTRYGLLSSKDSNGGDSWRDGHGALLNKYFVVVAKDATNTTQSSHIIRPIPLECLRLTSSDDEPEVRKQDQSIFRRIWPCSSSPTTKLVHPFTIFHAAARMTRRHTLYAESATERNRWKNVLKEAIEAQKAKQNNNLLYTLQTLDDKFFRVAPPTPLTRGGHFTGKALCAAEFSYRGGHYLAVGCTNGVYVRDRSNNSPFQSVLESDKPTSIVAIPESNAFLVHCESKLFSYRLDHIVCVTQGDTGSKNNDDWETMLAEDVLFFKAGRIDDQILIVYSARKFKQVTSHVLKLTCGQNEVPHYKLLGSPMSTPGDPQDATFLTKEVVICSSKALYIVKPTETPSFRTVVPELPNSKRSTNPLRRALKGVQSLFKEDKNSDPPKVLGLMKCENKNLIVYDGLGYFMDEDGNSTRPTYHVSWECMATAFARRGSHLLLFSSGFIEVRNVDTGELIQIIERHDVRPLRCGWAEHRMVVAATAGDAENDGSRMETLVELI